MTRWFWLVTWFGCVVLGGCSPTQEPPTQTQPQAVAGVQIQMDFSRSEGFYSAPFPSEDLRGANGRISLKGFPNPNNVDFVQELIAIIERDARGFGVSSGIFFRTTASLAGATFPSYADTVRKDSPIVLIGVDPSAPDKGNRYPVLVKFEDDGGPFGTPHQLSLLPLQGVPLRPHTLYAAVIRRSLKDSQGRPLGVSLSMAQLAAGARPEALSEEAFARYRQALKTLQAEGIASDSIAGLAVFHTDDPTAGLREAVAQVQKVPAPALSQGWKRTELYDDFCVYESALSMPVFQQGKPPFMAAQGGGGAWVTDEKGALVQQGTEPSRVVLTIPRRAMPAKGYPVVAFVRTGGGGDRPLVDRGVRDKKGGPAVEKGSGPARNFARAGFAGVSLDGPHGGKRNVTHGDEQFLIFNITNPVAMRDNIRQSALELTLVPRLLSSWGVDVSDCPGATAPQSKARFHGQRLALMGHSMGATIAPLVLANAPAFRAAILSGAGGSWVENIVHKKSPLEVRPLAETLLLYPTYQRSLHVNDPVLSLLQWGGEPSDPPVYARTIVQEPGDAAPRHILMLQGIVDTYILPPIANALSLALGLDLAGPALDEADKRLASFRTLREVLPLASGSSLRLPQQGNRTVQQQQATALVVQHKEGPVEDGHEVVFQTEGPKHQYRCFLESFAKGKIPRVLVAGKEWDACDP